MFGRIHYWTISRSVPLGLSPALLQFKNQRLKNKRRLSNYITTREVFFVKEVPCEAMVHLVGVLYAGECTVRLLIRSITSNNPEVDEIWDGPFF